MHSKLLLILQCIVVFGLAAGHWHKGGNHHHHHHRHGGHGGHGRHYGPHGPNGHHHHWHRHAPFVNFEVHEPKGLVVSTIKRSPNTTFFGIELYVNQFPNNGTQCDVCLNTTEVTYGKFIVEDDEVVIKKGDILNYFVLLGNDNNVTRLHLQKLWVTDSIINKCNCEEKQEVFPNIDVRFSDPNRGPTFGQRPQLPEIDTTERTYVPRSESDENELSSHDDAPFECDLDPVTNLCRTTKRSDGQTEKLEHSQSDFEREIQILETIIDQMKSVCGPKRVSNILLLRLSSQDRGDTNDQMMDLVRSSLSVNAEMRELAGRIKRVMPITDSRGRAATFEMPCYVDKQKVLYHARMNNLGQVMDYDFVRRH